MNWRAAIGRRAFGIVGTYFGNNELFSTVKDIREHVEWLLPAKDTDEREETNEGEGVGGDGSEEEEGASGGIEDAVRRRKRKFIGAPFLWENGLIGPSAGIKVRKHARSGSPIYDWPNPHPPFLALGISFKPARP